MIEAKFTHQQAAVIVAAVIRHQEGIPPLDTVLANILEQDIYNPIISQLDAGFEDAEAIRRVRDCAVFTERSRIHSPSDLASAMSALTREEALEIASVERATPETFPVDAVPEEEPESGSNPAENDAQVDGQNPGQKDLVLLEIIAKKPEATASEVLVAEAKWKLRKACHEAVERTGISSIRALSLALGFSESLLGNNYAPSTKISLERLTELLQMVEAFGRKAGGRKSPLRDRTIAPTKAPISRRPVALEPAQMFQALQAIALHPTWDDAALGETAGLCGHAVRAVSIIREEYSSWVREIKEIFDQMLSPAAQRDHLQDFMRKLCDTAAASNGAKFTVYLPEIETPDMEDEEE